VIPLGKGRVDREGTDVTIVTYGATVELSRRAADQVADEMSVEIIDLRCLIPWDQELVAASVSKTSRLLVVHEDIGTCGFGAEVAAWAAEHCFDDLDAPVRRVTAQDCHVAYEPTLERAILPQVEDIVAGLRALCRY
jgi:2-oxoisovalerate dehydrogenase E1 component